MILYLSSPQHTNLLDYWSSQSKEPLTPIKKLVGNFVLKQYVIYDMRNFSHISEVILDRTAFNDTDLEFIDAIQNFLIMYSARITVICIGLKKESILFSKLLECGVYNIICGTEINIIQREIDLCLSKEGMKQYIPYQNKEFIAQPVNSSKYQFDCENIKIVVLASQSRMGATTIAMGFCTWLKSIGATVAYVEANTKGHLAQIARSYEMAQIENGWVFDEIIFSNEPPLQSVNFIVYDIGNELTANIVTADILLLVCGTRPYEIKQSMLLKQRMKAKHAFIILPFVHMENRNIYTEVFHSENHTVMFSEWQSNLLDDKINISLYKTIVTKYLVGVC